MIECFTPIVKPRKWLITTRDHNGTLVNAQLEGSLLKANSDGAGQVFDITKNLFSNESRREQNEALLYDGESVLSIHHDGYTVTIEPLQGK